MEALILAGGKGTRMHPLTKVIPKPLLPLGEKSIIEIILDQLIEKGFTKIYISTGYMADYLKLFLEKKPNYQGKISFVFETTPLGTAGPLRLISDKIKVPFLVINGDTLTDLDYSNFLEFHNTSNLLCTLAIHKKPVKIDLGVIEVDETGYVSRYIEKPTLEYSVSTGIYAFSPKIFEFIGDDNAIKSREKFDLPFLVERLISADKNVGTYFFEGTWKDLGRVEDYHEAMELFEKEEGLSTKK